MIDLVRRHIVRMHEGRDLTAQELTFAKQSVLNRLLLDFDNPFRVASQRAYYRYYGYPDHYWRVYRDGIRKVALSDIRRVAKTYLHPDGLKMLVLGPDASPPVKK